MPQAVGPGVLPSQPSIIVVCAMFIARQGFGFPPSDLPHRSCTSHAARLSPALASLIALTGRKQFVEQWLSKRNRAPMHLGFSDKVRHDVRTSGGDVEPLAGICREIEQ
jgi:hypothetical protein